MLSKKEYELIARVIRSLPDEWATPPFKRRELGRKFADELEKTNPKFDRERFYRACEGV